MFWNFIRIKLLDVIGLRLTSLITLTINGLILLLTYNISYDEYEEETCQYSLLKIILFFFNWVFMAIGFGASSLLAQKKFIDYYSVLNNEPDSNPLDDNKITNNNDKNKNSDKFDEIIKKIENAKNKIKNRNISSLLIFGSAVILGYFGKFGIAMIFSYYNKNSKNQNNEITNYLNFTNNSIFNRNNSYVNDINIGKAVRSSCSYPVVFEPCEFRGKQLVDGGLRENVPWKLVKEKGADKVLSIISKSITTQDSPFISMQLKPAFSHTLFAASHPTALLRLL